jgi:hypothetical protein
VRYQRASRIPRHSLSRSTIRTAEMNGLRAHQVHREILDRMDVLKELIAERPTPATGRNKPPKSIERPPAININEISSISLQISEVEAILRQFRLSNEKNSRAVPELPPGSSRRPARGLLKQAREALDYLTERAFNFMTIVSP